MKQAVSSWSLTTYHTVMTGAVVLFGLAFGIQLAKSHEAGPPSSKSNGPDAAAKAVARVPLDLRNPVLESGRYVVRRTADTAVLTLVPHVQEAAARVLKTYAVPFGAVVALEPNTGRVLAYVSHSSDEPTVQDLVLDASPPAASVFKVVTSAALLGVGVSPETKACYSGGLHRIESSDLVDNSKLDKACITLATALGGSVNTVFAKLATRHLTPAALSSYAEMFQFNKAIPFDAETTASKMEVPSERLEFARTAAGFWHSHLSPLHGAVMAAIVANGGNLVTPYVVDAWVESTGKSTAVTHTPRGPQVLKPDIAKSLSGMMEKTVSEGTSRSAFYSNKGEPYLKAARIAGKTGSLSTAEPYRAYSWWIGFAPADKPTVALAVLIVNGPKWRIKSSYAARVVLEAALRTKTPAASIAIPPQASAPK